MAAVARPAAADANRRAPAEHVQLKYPHLDKPTSLMTMIELVAEEMFEFPKNALRAMLSTHPKRSRQSLSRKLTKPQNK